jgi:hypothetical protein
VPGPADNLISWKRQLLRWVDRAPFRLVDRMMPAAVQRLRDETSRAAVNRHASEQLAAASDLWHAMPRSERYAHAIQGLFQPEQTIFEAGPSFQQLHVYAQGQIAVRFLLDLQDRGEELGSPALLVDPARIDLQSAIPTLMAIRAAQQQLGVPVGRGMTPFDARTLRALPGERPSIADVIAPTGLGLLAASTTVEGVLERPSPRTTDDNLMRRHWFATQNAEALAALFGGAEPDTWSTRERLLVAHATEGLMLLVGDAGHIRFDPQSGTLFPLTGSRGGAIEPEEVVLRIGQAQLASPSMIEGQGLSDDGGPSRPFTSL